MPGPYPLGRASSPGAGRRTRMGGPGRLARGRNPRGAGMSAAASVAVAGLARDRALVAEALAVVGFFVADVLGAVVGVADVAEPVGAREIRAAGGLVEEANGVQPQDLRGAAVQRRDRERFAGVALLGQGGGDQALDDGLGALHAYGQRSHALAEDEQQTGPNAVDRLAEDGLAAGRGLAEGADDAGDALVLGAGGAAPVI